MCQQQDGFILYDSFPSIYFKISVSQIPQISTIRKKLELSISNDMWPHVFRYEVGSYFLYFLVTYLAYIYIYRMRKLSTYFEDGKVLESTVSLFLIESN